MDAIRELLKADEPVKWLFYGDSITHGALHTFGRRDYTELFAERVRYEMARTRDVVINTAVSGNTTRPLLQDFDWRVAQFKPDVVFLMIGMNDCSDNNDIGPDEFEENLNELADRVETLDGSLGLQTTCPILPGAAPDREPNLPIFMDVIRSVAAERDLPLVDHTRFWEQNAEKLYYWMSNAFHPNEYGHLAFANLLFRELDILDPESQTCRLHFP